MREGGMSGISEASAASDRSPILPSTNSPAAPVSAMSDLSRMPLVVVHALSAMQTTIESRRVAMGLVAMSDIQVVRNKNILLPARRGKSLSLKVRVYSLGTTGPGLRGLRGLRNYF